jgi:hypothetical protein
VPASRSFSGASAIQSFRIPIAVFPPPVDSRKTRPQKCPVTGGLNGTFNTRSGLLIGYARVSTNDQDIAAQKNALFAFGASLEKTFTDQGLTGANKSRPGLREALAACPGRGLRTKLGRWARSLRDAKCIGDELTRREAMLSIGRSVRDPPVPWAGFPSTSLPWVSSRHNSVRVEVMHRMAVPVAPAPHSHFFMCHHTMPCNPQAMGAGLVSPRREAAPAGNQPAVRCSSVAARGPQTASPAPRG